MVALVLARIGSIEVEFCEGTYYQRTIERDETLDELEGWWDFILSFHCVVHHYSAQFVLFPSTQSMKGV
jgi:hypothetical protein